jgi:hypothetical protein
MSRMEDLVEPVSFALTPPKMPKPLLRSFLATNMAVVHLG